MALCHQFISEDPANCGFPLLYFVMLHSCIPFVDACRPNLHIGNCTESKGSLHPLLVLGCIPPAAIDTYFFISQLFPVHAQFLPSLGMHWACASCTGPFQPSTVPTIQAHTAQYKVVFPQHTKFSQQFLSPVGLSTSCSRSFTLSQCTEQPINPKSTAMAQFPLKTSPHGATQRQNAIPTRR